MLPRAVNVEAKTPFLFARGRRCALRDVIWILHWLLMERRLTANLRLIMGNLLCTKRLGFLDRTIIWAFSSQRYGPCPILMRIFWGSDGKNTFLASCGAACCCTHRVEPVQVRPSTKDGGCNVFPSPQTLIVSCALVPGPGKAPPRPAAQKSQPYWPNDHYCFRCVRTEANR